MSAPKRGATTSAAATAPAPSSRSRYSPSSVSATVDRMRCSAVTPSVSSSASRSSAESFSNAYSPQAPMRATVHPRVRTDIRLSGRH